MRPPRASPHVALALAAGLLGLATIAAAVEIPKRFVLLRLALQRSPDALPSTALVSPDDIGQNLPLLSLVLDEPSLFDPLSGILSNPLERGRRWERAASVSYFDEGRLKFGAVAGVRVHGGGSRRARAPQSYRLYFRRSYGTAAFSSGVLFGGSADPIRSLVVHNDRRWNSSRFWHFNNPMGYDIARQVGTLTVRTQPVQVFLNGESQGVYVLTEHLGPGFFRSHFGHGDFFPTEADTRELREWLVQERPLTMARVGQRVDLDNLTRWFVAHVFCDTIDAYQSPGQFRDSRAPAGRWFWIPWDMDQSFRHWDHDTAGILLDVGRFRRHPRVPNEPRAFILSALIDDDEEYRTFLKQVVTETLNHRLTPEFLNERFAYYASIADSYGMSETAYRRILRDFLARRPAYFRGIMERLLRTGRSTRLTLQAPPDAEITVDGYRVHNAFVGHYFPDSDVRLTASTRPGGRPFSHWLVNGLLRVAPSLTLPMDSDATVEAVLR